MAERDKDGSMVPVPGAGGGGFEEELYVAKFLRKVMLRAKGDDWFVCGDGKAWVSVESDRFLPLAKQLLPRGMRSEKNMAAIISGAGADRQLTLGEEFVSAIIFRERELLVEGETVKEREVLVNCQNGVLRVTKGNVELLPHMPEMLFMACLDAEWHGEWRAEMAPLFMKLLVALYRLHCGVAEHGRGCPVPAQHRLFPISQISHRLRADARARHPHRH